MKVYHVGYLNDFFDKARNEEMTLKLLNELPLRGFLGPLIKESKCYG